MKNLVILSLIILVLPKVQAQQLDHKAKSHQSDDGTVYWNKSMPVYVRIASTPEDKGVLLKNDQQANYTNPIYFDTEGINYIRTRNAVDNQTLKQVLPVQEVLLPVYADGQAPVSKANYLNTERLRADNVEYFGKGLIIELLSADAVSGVESIYYSLGGKPYVKYTSNIPINIPGDNVLKYYAVDFVGNVEFENEKHITVDHEEPISSFLSEGPQIDNTFTFGSKFYINAVDSASGVKNTYYKFDDAPYQKYQNKGININHLEDGHHKLTYYSIDHVNNQETEKTYQLFFDKSAPLMAADILGDRFIVDEQIYFSGRTKLKLTAVDNRVGVKQIKYSINNEAFKSYENPFYLPNKTGSHLIRYYAEDNFGNKTNDDKTSGSFHEYEHFATKVYVDLTGPNLHYGFEGELLETRDTVFVNSNTKLIFEAHDTESGLQKITYSLEGSAEEFQYLQPISFEKKGYHAVDFYGYDNVNNRNVSHLNMFVDNIGPQIFCHFSSEPHEKSDNNRLIYSPNVNIYLAATDDHSGLRNIYYTINGSKEQIYGKQIRGLKRNEDYVLVIRAVDNLGNDITKEISFSTAKK